ncbi:hypothetical protein ACC694_37650, partial [Rhizobium ruizarguesonis]
NAFGPLADFYGGMAGLPTEDIDRAARNVSGIDGNALSPRDQALQGGEAFGSLGGKRFGHYRRDGDGSACADQLSDLLGNIADAGCNDRRRLDFVTQLQFL